MTAPDDLREGRRALARALDAMDRDGPFDRCSFGGQSCEGPPIGAHCIPRTALRLIAGQGGRVFGTHSRAPKTPDHWAAQLPLADHHINSFSVGYWACADHDACFSPIDSVNIDVTDESNLFLICYRTLAYLCYSAIHAASRLAIPMLDPAVETPSGFPNDIEAGLRRTAIAMSEGAAQLYGIKARIDKLWQSQSFQGIEYRIAQWPTVPSMAAVGMRIVDRASQSHDGRALHSASPEWLVLLPQSYGQLLITASLPSTNGNTSRIHQGMPMQEQGIARRGNSWTRLQCMKFYEFGTDIAVSYEAKASTSPQHIRNLQRYFSRRSISNGPSGKMPNLLRIRQE